MHKPPMLSATLNWTHFEPSPKAQSVVEKVEMASDGDLAHRKLPVSDWRVNRANWLDAGSGCDGPTFCGPIAQPGRRQRHDEQC